MSANETGRDWGLFFSGLIVLISGAVIMFWPGLSLVAIAVFAGVMLLFAGVFDIVNYVRFKGTSFTNGWAIVNAICCLVLGAIFVIHPVVSASVISMLAAIFIIAYGVMAIVASIKLKPIPGWWLMLLNGIVSILCGIMFIITPASFAIFLGIFLVMRGVTMSYYGITEPKFF